MKSRKIYESEVNSEVLRYIGTAAKVFIGEVVDNGKVLHKIQV